MTAVREQPVVRPGRRRGEEETGRAGRWPTAMDSAARLESASSLVAGRDAFGATRLDADGGMDGLGQAVKHIGPQGARTFEEATEGLRGNARLGGYLADEPTAPMNRSTQMAAERLFPFGFHHPVVPFAEFPQLFGDCGAFPPELFQEFR